MAVHDILVVDDSRTELVFLRSLLTRNGYHVRTAENAEQALLELGEQLPDLILMDVVMPNLNGFQATRAISKEAATAHIPIVLVTTKDQETDKVWGMRQGAKAYITKPFNESQLVEVINSLLTSG